MTDYKDRLVFIPGWGADQRCWQELESRLNTTFDTSHYEWKKHSNLQNASWLDELEHLSDALPEQSVVVAWSLGAMLAVQLAVRRPQKIKALVVISANLSFIQRENWPYAMEDAVFSKFVQDFSENTKRTTRRFNSLQAEGDPEAKKIQKKLAGVSAITDDSAEADLARLRYLGDINNIEYFYQLTQPTLSIFGENDALVSNQVPESIRMYSKKHNINHIDVVTVNACGHAPQISHADILSGEILSFLGKSDLRYKKNKKRIANSFSKASADYDQSSALQKKVANTLCARAIGLEQPILDVGCGTGYCLQALAEKKYNDFFALDIAEAMLHQLRNKEVYRHLGNGIRLCNGDLESLPFGDASMGSIVSSLAIQWSDHLNAVFDEAARVLRNGGIFSVSSLGPKTLWELAGAWLKVDQKYVHVNKFIDAHTVMDCAEQFGFNVELFSVDFEVLEYRSAIALMKDLKAIGAHNVNEGNMRGLMGSTTLKAIEKEYAVHKLPSGMLPATYEVYYWVFKKNRVV